MSYRVRVSVHQLNLMLRALDADATLDIMLQADQIAQVALLMPREEHEDGEELMTLLQAVLQEPESERIVHSLVI